MPNREVGTGDPVRATSLSPPALPGLWQSREEEDGGFIGTWDGSEEQQPASAGFPLCPLGTSWSSQHWWHRQLPGAVGGAKLNGEEGQMGPTFHSSVRPPERNLSF